MTNRAGTAGRLSWHVLTPNARHARLMQALARKRGRDEPTGEDGPERFWTTRWTRALCRRKDTKR